MNSITYIFLEEKLYLTLKVKNLTSFFLCVIF